MSATNAPDSYLSLEQESTKNVGPTPVLLPHCFYISGKMKNVRQSVRASFLIYFYKHSIYKHYSGTIKTYSDVLKNYETGVH